MGWNEATYEAFMNGRVGKSFAKNSIETKGPLVVRRYADTIEELDAKVRAAMAADEARFTGSDWKQEAFTREWAEIIGLYNVMQANRPSVRTNDARGAAQAELHRHAVGQLSLKLMQHGIGPLSRIIALGDSDPAKVLDALAPRSMLKPPVDKHFGPMVQAESEAELASMVQRHRAAAAHLAGDHALAGAYLKFDTA